MQSEWKKGAADMRDNVIAHIIGMQNDLGNDIEDKGVSRTPKVIGTYRRMIWKNDR